MYRLQTVSYVRQGAADDDRHGVVEIARLHLVDDVDGADVRRICEDCLVAAQNLTLFTILPILPMGADPSGGAGACHPSRTRARETIAVIGGRSAIYSPPIRPGHGRSRHCRNFYAIRARRDDVRPYNAPSCPA